MDTYEAVSEGIGAFLQRGEAFLWIISLGFLLLISAGIILDLIILIFKGRKRELLVRCSPHPVVEWNIWDGLKIIALFLFLGYAIAIIEALIAPAVPFIKNNQNVMAIANTTVLNLITVILVFNFVITRYGQRAADLGLTLKNFFKNLLYGITGYISAIPILLITLFITAIVSVLLNYKPEPQPIFEMFLKEEKGGLLIYLSLFVAIAGPVMEEIFFRGFIYSAIRKKTGAWWAILISAAVFSLLHVHVVGFMPILILGMCLAYLYEKTGSLIPCIAFHITHNLIMVSLMLMLKGII